MVSLKGTPAYTHPNEATCIERQPEQSTAAGTISCELHQEAARDNRELEKWTPTSLDVGPLCKAVT